MLYYFNFKRHEILDYFWQYILKMFFSIFKNFKEYFLKKGGDFCAKSFDIFEGAKEERKKSEENIVVQNGAKDLFFQHLFFWDQKDQKKKFFFLFFLRRSLLANTMRILRPEQEIKLCRNVRCRWRARFDWVPPVDFWPRNFNNIFIGKWIFIILFPRPFFLSKCTSMHFLNHFIVLKFLIFKMKILTKFKFISCSNAS